MKRGYTMKYDFDTVINRRNTSSLKWDTAEKRVGQHDVLPLWVADMDFQSPAPVIDAFKKRVEHGVFGYTVIPDSCYNAVVGWMKRRHNWEVKKEWIMFTPGVVPVLHWTVMAYTHPGDKVIIQPPVYYPFFKAARFTGRQVVENHLKYENGRYVMDFEELEKQFDSRTKLFILCSPHNPVGRVWTREELTRLGELCLKHNVLICSDEIHSDLIFKGFTHIPTASISDEIAQITVTCSAPTKTFNFVGTGLGFVIIPNKRLFNDFSNAQHNVGHEPELSNLFGVLATEVAYTHGEDWLEQVLEYLQDNLDFLTNYIERNIPKIRVVQPEGTYLVWLDCRALGMTDVELKKFMLKQAKVWLNGGPVFGSKETGFQRINIGCPRSILEEALKRIEHAVKELS
jgi:cystathionine beta-lyase